jgi:hypothetical protein
MGSELSRVYVSYDLAHDVDLRERLVAEARSSAWFAVAACSEAGNASASDERLRESIAAADLVIVICGEHTDESPGVSAELRIAQEEQKPQLLLWGRRASMCKKPTGAGASDAIYGWTPEVLRSQLQLLTRVKREPPERLRRVAPPKPNA